MKNTDIRKFIPYIGAIIIFLIITFAYFTPLLEGKKILQSDIVNFQGMSKEIVDFRAKTGQEPLWTNAMFGGMPAYQVSTVYKGNQLGFLDKVMTLGLPHPANLVFLYFVGFFILLLAMGVNPWLSVIGAAGYALSSYFFIIIEAGHNSKAHAIAYMAPVIAGMILTFKRKYLWGGLLTAVFLSLEVKANHPQITYYLAMIAVILGIVKLIHAVRFKELVSFFKAAGILVIAALFALLTNITSLWATWEYGKYTIRGKSELTTEKHNRTSGLDKDYATQWSYGIGETMTLLIPDFYGGSSNIRVSDKSKIVEAMRSNGVPDESIRQFTGQPLPFIYWGSQPFTSGPVYVGAIFIFLFFLGLIVVKGPIRWWLLTATLLSIVLAWGHNLMPVTEFFMHYLPGYNKFRAVTMILVIAEFAIPLLGILALKEIFDGNSDRKKTFNALKTAFAISAGICLVFIVMPGVFLNFSGARDAMYQQNYQLPDWLMQGIRDERLRLVRLDALRSFIFITLSAGLIWTVVFGKLKKEYAFVILLLLVIADMFPVNKRYFGNESFTSKSRVENPYEQSAADAEIMKDQTPGYRVLNFTVDPFNDASTSYFHKSIGGYHGAKLRRYQELIEHHIQKEMQIFAGSMSTDSMPVINMLNTKYFILPGRDRSPMPYTNVNALGSAWIVDAYKVVDNADAEINALENLRPDSLAIVDRQFSGFLENFTPVSDTNARVAMTSYAANALEYQYTSSTPSLVVFSEIYYPKGWQAFIDGQPAAHFRANYVLRAMVVPAGDHKITFRFEPSVYSTGETISTATSILLIILVLAMAATEIRKHWKAKA